MEKKYVLTNEVIEVECSYHLYRIKAVKDFSDVKVGDLGGFVQSENNLSHDGDCWVYDNAGVYNNAQVTDNSVVKDFAIVKDGARVKGDSVVQHRAAVLGSAIVDSSIINNSSVIFGDALVSGSFVCDAVHIFKRAHVSNSRVRGSVYICGDAEISDVELCGIQRIGGSAEIHDDKDYMTLIINGEPFTSYRQKTGDVGVYWWFKSHPLSKFVELVDNPNLEEYNDISDDDRPILKESTNLVKVYFGVE